MVNTEYTFGGDDSFDANSFHLFLQKKSLQNALAYSYAIDSIIASKSGANEPVSSYEIQQLLKR